MRPELGGDGAEVIDVEVRGGPARRGIPPGLRLEPPPRVSGGEGALASGAVPAVAARPARRSQGVARPAEERLPGAWRDTLALSFAGFAAGAALLLLWLYLSVSG